VSPCRISTPSDGRIVSFRPLIEQPGGYGYFGQHKTCKRNIDGYRFRVPDGKYMVRLYMRYAYEPKFNRENPLDFPLEANDEPLFRNLDFFREMKGDLRNPVILSSAHAQVPAGEGLHGPPLQHR